MIHSKEQVMNKFPSFLTAVIVTFCGGLLFSLIDSPVPWLLGPIVGMLLATRYINTPLYWPPVLRNSGLIILGYSFGLELTREALVEIGYKLPVMFLMTVLIVVFSAVMAYLISKLTGADYPTVLTGSIPGGLSQMILFAEEAKGMDVTTVSFLQVSRLLMVVFIVPFIVILGPFAQGMDESSLVVKDSVSTSSSLFPNLLMYIIICLLMAKVGQKLKAPTPYLLGPIVGTALLNLTDFQAPYLSNTILDFSQWMIGGYIGLLLNPRELKSKKKLILLACISGFLLIFASMAFSLVLVRIYGVSLSTAFLSLAPGGMEQMGILAHEGDADVSIVTAFQIFRLLFIFFAVPPLLRFVFRRKLQNQNPEQNTG
ncbi:AbrB family transcriptional regulator [Mesobacillus maritimus]|uniref:AbrB family transcriptional regulator n=1 Tax=Mesobacillus maritimus TaxID=1643336 RepID=UPI00203C289F|nr:AbrB family transcriptional regulator [Mesobacillus maritimus]MCM3584478.1 AbrB family transcriptional regulator [Mesobacillus maritimus]MCM3670789.1 AbrB family transcriptional regulator [Mesobacillus maritimus]